jgi:hypothetical protein
VVSEHRVEGSESEGEENPVAGNQCTEKKAIDNKTEFYFSLKLLRIEDRFLARVILVGCCEFSLHVHVEVISIHFVGFSNGKNYLKYQVVRKGE